MTTNPDTLRALAIAFCGEVSATLTAAQLADVNRENKNNGEACATHVYCDANELMISAFVATIGREPYSAVSQEEDASITDAALQADADLQNEAWSLARSVGFTARHIKPSVAEFSADLTIPPDLTLAQWESEQTGFDVYRFIGDAASAEGPWRYLGVDAVDPEMRADVGGMRFTVSLETAEDGYVGNLYEGDDFNAALAVMRDPCATIRE